MTGHAVTAVAPIHRFSHESTNAKVFAIIAPLLAPGARVLDLGAGEGYFSKVIGDHLRTRLGVDPATVLSACDVTPGLFRYDGVTCQCIDGAAPLPYPDSSFDVVCCIEVIEHVEDHFRLCREIMRVLKPGGTAVISTPNVLNLNSRYRILHSGFATLFNPLPLSSVDVVHTTGHIHPISHYYLAYALHRAGARELRAEFDRIKRSALFLLLFCWPFLVLGHLGFKARLRRKEPRAAIENVALLREVQSLRMLTSRSIVVRAVK